MFAKRSIQVIMSVGLVLSGLTSPAHARATTSTQQAKIEVGYIVPSPCTGDPVEVFDEFTMVSHITQSAHGDTFQLTHLSSTGATGTGLSTGDTYHVVDVFNFHDDLSGAPYAATLMLRQQFKAPGPGSDFVVFAQIHFTIAANGEGHAEITHVRTECR